MTKATRTLGRQQRGKVGRSQKVQAPSKVLVGTTGGPFFLEFAIKLGIVGFRTLRRIDLYGF